jgi:hypothetical protein
MSLASSFTTFEDIHGHFKIELMCEELIVIKFVVEINEKTSQTLDIWFFLQAIEES